MSIDRALSVGVSLYVFVKCAVTKAMSTFLFTSGQIITASLANIMSSGSTFSPRHSVNGETKTPQRRDYYDLYLGKM